MLSGFALAAALGLASLAAQAQPAGQAGQPQWKDGQTEYNMFAAAQKETDPKKKLALIDAWKEKYPETDFKMPRLQLYLNAYQQLNDMPHLLATLKDMLKLDPKDLSVMSPLMYYTIISGSNTPEALDSARKAATDALANLDNKPASIKDDQWPQAKKQIEALAHKTLGWVAMQRKDSPTSQQEFLKSLQIDPNQAEVDYWLGNTLRAEKTPEKVSQALFFYARAATIDGQGALPPQGRQQIEDYLRKAYTAYHGQDDAGLTELKNLAKSQPLPPEGFNIKTAQQIAIEKENEFKQSNPQLAMWMSLKKELTGPNGNQFFESNMKGASVPGGAEGVQKFKATIVEAKPAVRSKELVVALADPKVPEATLKLDAPLTGKPEVGSQVEFEGVPVAFSADPFNITFDVEKAKLKDLKMTAAPTVTHKKAVTRKK
jgi:tetratricopeptide (TPR) repeat protein